MVSHGLPKSLIVDEGETSVQNLSRHPVFTVASQDGILSFLRFRNSTLGRVACKVR